MSIWTLAPSRSDVPRERSVAAVTEIRRSIHASGCTQDAGQCLRQLPAVDLQPSIPKLQAMSGAALHLLRARARDTGRVQSEVQVQFHDRRRPADQDNA
jgi:hypothetical protein